MKKITNLSILSILLSTISFNIVYARDNNRDGGYSNGLSQCYKIFKSRSGDQHCVTRQQYDTYLKYADAVNKRREARNQKWAEEYKYQNGRLKLLPNGRYLAKENDVEFVNQEVTCTDYDYFVRNKRSCTACDTGYQNTLTGGYGGSTAYNNNIACAVHQKGDGRFNGNINVGNNFNPTGAIVGAIGGAIGGIGSGNSSGGSGTGGSGTGGGMPGGNLATKAFACLEYHTNSNGMTTGGEHLKFSINSHYCAEPMTYYYNSLEAYYCTQAGCYYLSPATIQIRKMWLYTNPYIFIGNTMARSDEIAQTRTTTSTYGSWKQVYVYPN